MGKKRRAMLAAQERDAVAGPGTTVTSVTLLSAIQPSSYPLTVIEAAGVAAVRRCVTLIANGIAGQPWVELEDRRPIDPPSRLVKRPAAMMSRREWVWRVVSQMALQDIAYLLMVGGVDDEGVPGSLIPLPSDAVAPTGYIDPWGVYPPTLYQISGMPEPISAEFIIPVRSAFWPGVPPHLVGILKMARNTMMQAYSSDAYGSRYWQQGGSPTTVITTEQELTNTQADQIGDRWRDRRTRGPDYPAVLGKGASASPWGADIANAVAIDARREIVVEISNLFGVPARYVNVVPTGQTNTYANLNDEALSLERFTLSGFVDPIQDVVSDLLPDPRTMQIDMTRLTRASQQSRFAAWAIATGGKPWMTPPEVRIEEGMTPNDEIENPPEASVEGGLVSAEPSNVTG